MATARADFSLELPACLVGFGRDGMGGFARLRGNVGRGVIFAAHLLPDRTAGTPAGRRRDETGPHARVSFAVVAFHDSVTRRYLQPDYVSPPVVCEPGGRVQLGPDGDTCAP